MTAARTAVLAMVGSLFLGAACLRLEIDDGALPCSSANMRCPSPYQCAADGFCRLTASTGGTSGGAAGSTGGGRAGGTSGSTGGGGGGRGGGTSGGAGGSAGGMNTGGNSGQKFQLTVTKNGNGVGIVIATGINCGADCGEAFDADTMVGLSAMAATTPLSADSTFQGWSGGGCSGTDPCTVTVTAATTVTATFVLKPNIVFVTSATTTGNMGGLAGADAICLAGAQAGGLTGTYRAWLSTSTTNAISRLGSASGWIRPDGKPLTNTTADLVAGRMFYPIRINEKVVDVGGDPVHTATAPDGRLETTSTTCDDFTAASSDLVEGGSAGGMAALFTASSLRRCDTIGRLYCFGVDRQATVAVAPLPAYRRAFVTNAGWVPGGIASADALCQQEVRDASLPGTYKALLATTTASAGSRFNTAGPPWARVDGVPLTLMANGLFQNASWGSANNLNAAGTVYFGIEPVWGGAATLTDVGTSLQTCADWTSPLSVSTGVGGPAGRTAIQANFGVDTNPCNATNVKLGCLQE